MLGRSRSGCAMPSIHVFLLSSIAAYTVSRASAGASVLLMIAAPQMLMKTAIVGGLDQPPSEDLFVPPREPSRHADIDPPAHSGLCRRGCRHRLPPAARRVRGR